MASNYKGVIIEESLEDTGVIKTIKVVSTKIENVTEKHRTPWVKTWTKYNVEISEEQADDVATILSQSLDSKHDWYADFKNDTFHYIIFKNRIFKINRSKKEEYDEATKYGIFLGIPDYQVNFSSFIKL
ncbi:MAG: hypothetical protein A2406_00865 [Candidatus Komeilibacteria bacterium RIFOXYC1_FULL_37_11]|uniref:Uncharacterized protein n=1 Tax=Candidatus Komeilibacteria bacterium RIFOXYC1_FULL_37_11 TaxID=1798555 RepID=A0A1G2BY40_9BACT|nr:MAG: hypothetical protein A2406_00865 [Candidatus Komeilibacteria bacterium RIFOXYC1_FULL_37_11]OGY95295.1 MAG: hypothetical protein A2611_01170 [Candidatus Komeilibacteria bacterium RIFOXYD1_FULL_37_29]